MMFLSVSMGVPFHDVRQWSAAELSLYLAYYRIEPWGEYRSDVRNAMSMQLLAAVNGNKRTVTDFMPDFDRKSAESDGEPAGLRSALASRARMSRL